MIKKLAIFVAIVCLTAVAASAESYSTEATLTRQKDKGTVLVEVCVSQLTESHGKLTERVICRPRIQTAPGVAADLYSGLHPTQANYKKENNVHVNVIWPKAGENGFAVCVILLKRGDKVVSESKLKVQVD